MGTSPSSYIPVPLGRGANLPSQNITFIKVCLKNLCTTFYSISIEFRALKFQMYFNCLNYREHGKFISFKANLKSYIQVLFLIFSNTNFSQGGSFTSAVLFLFKFKSRLKRVKAGVNAKFFAEQVQTCFIIFDTYSIKTYVLFHFDHEN